MIEMQKDLCMLVDYHASMLMVKTEVQTEQNKVNKNFRGRRDTLAKDLEAGGTPKELAKIVAARMLSEQSDNLTQYPVFYPTQGTVEYSISETTTFEHPALAVFAEGSQTYYHTYFNKVWNDQHGVVVEDLPKAANRLAKLNRSSCYKVLPPFKLSVNPPGPSTETAESQCFDVVADISPVMYAQRVSSYFLPPKPEPPRRPPSAAAQKSQVRFKGAPPYPLTLHDEEYKNIKRKNEKFQKTEVLDGLEQNGLQIRIHHEKH